jgi:VIT1/CCC1 family predicted Fe2+/Mn2+ transporter
LTLDNRPTRGTPRGRPWRRSRSERFPPLLEIVLPSTTWRVPVTMIAVAFALIVTGTVSAALGGAPRAPAVLRNVGVGLLTMGITFGTGVLVGAIL